MSSLHPKSQARIFRSEFPPDLKTDYVNLVRIAHSPSEMVFDFAQLLAGRSQGHGQIPHRDVHRWGGQGLFLRRPAGKPGEITKPLREIILSTVEFFNSG